MSSVAAAKSMTNALSAATRRLGKAQFIAREPA